MGSIGSKEENLNEEELRAINDSWRMVMENPEENGSAIFKVFLEKHNYYSKFEKFKGIPTSELPESKIFKEHSLAIIKAMNNIVENINDDETLQTLLVQLGRLHKRRQVTGDQFGELKTVILEVLQSAFQLSDDSLKAWNKTFNIAFAHVFKGLGEEN